MEDYELLYECSCPKCGHSPIHQRDCSNLMCQDGFEDEYDDDPINFYPGESIISCNECKGTGFQTWCPNCGKDLTGYEFQSDHDEIEKPFENPNQLNLF